MRPRAAEILKAVVAQLASGASGEGSAGETVVLTGGGSQLAGFAEFASSLLQRPVRIGQAAQVSGLPPVARGPAFATVTGLLLASDDYRGQTAAGSGAGPGGSLQDRLQADVQDGYIQRVGAWLKSGF